MLRGGVLAVCGSGRGGQCKPRARARDDDAAPPSRGAARRIGVFTTVSRAASAPQTMSAAAARCCKPASTPHTQQRRDVAGSRRQPTHPPLPAPPTPAPAGQQILCPPRHSTRRSRGASADRPAAASGGSPPQVPPSPLATAFVPSTFPHERKHSTTHEAGRHDE